MGRIPYWTVVLPYEIGKLLAEDFIAETSRMLLSNDRSDTSLTNPMVRIVYNSLIFPFSWSNDWGQP